MYLMYVKRKSHPVSNMPYLNATQLKKKKKKSSRSKQPSGFITHARDLGRNPVITLSMEKVLEFGFMLAIQAAVTGTLQHAIVAHGRNHRTSEVYKS